MQTNIYLTPIIFEIYKFMHIVNDIYLILLTNINLDIAQKYKLNSLPYNFNIFQPHFR